MACDVDPETGLCRRPEELAAVQERIRWAEQRLTEVREELLRLSRQVVDEREVAAGLATFDLVSKSLSPREQARLLRLLIERVVFWQVSKVPRLSLNQAVALCDPYYHTVSALHTLRGH